MTEAANTSTRIIDCARTLILGGGYHSFSYADISKVVGIRTASIHHHFPAKADLVRTLVLRYRQEALTGLSHLERNTPGSVEQLRAYTGYWEACIGDDSAPFCVCALLASQIPALPPEVAHEVRTHFQTLSDWLTRTLERGAAAGLLRLTGSPRAEAEAFMAAVQGAMLTARAYGDPAAFGVVTRVLLERLIVA